MSLSDFSLDIGWIVFVNLSVLLQVLFGDSGHFYSLPRHRDLRFEMDVLLVLSTAPHPLDPATAYAPGTVQTVAWRSGTAGADDICRQHCAQNGRGFINTERCYL